MFSIYEILNELQKLEPVFELNREKSMIASHFLLTITGLREFLGIIHENHSIHYKMTNQSVNNESYPIDLKMKAFQDRARGFLDNHVVLRNVHVLYQTLSEALRLYIQENLFIWKNYEFLNNLDRQIIAIQQYIDEMKYIHVQPIGQALLNCVRDLNNPHIHSPSVRSYPDLLRILNINIDRCLVQNRKFQKALSLLKGHYPEKVKLWGEFGKVLRFGEDSFVQLDLIGNQIALLSVQMRIAMGEYRIEDVKNLGIRITKGILSDSSLDAISEEA